MGWSKVNFCDFYSEINDAKNQKKCRKWGNKRKTLLWDEGYINSKLWMETDFDRGLTTD